MLAVYRWDPPEGGEVHFVVDLTEGGDFLLVRLSSLPGASRWEGRGYHRGYWDDREDDGCVLRVS